MNLGDYSVKAWQSLNATASYDFTVSLMLSVSLLTFTSDLVILGKIVSGLYAGTSLIYWKIHYTNYAQELKNFLKVSTFAINSK